LFEFYVQHEYAFAAVQLALAMLGMGATLAPRDFTGIARDPKGFGVGITLQVLGVPLVAWTLLQIVELDPGVAIGIALCSAIPGGTVSNIFTYFARGHVALSIVLTSVATLGCLVTAPLVLSVLIARHMPAAFEMPIAQIALEIGLFLLLPLAAGMAMLQFAPRLAPTVSKLGVRGSLFVIGLIVIGATGAGRLDLEAFGFANVPVVLAFLLALTAMALLVPSLARLPWPDVAAIGIEVSVRNTNLGLLIKASLFPAVVGVADPVGDQVFFAVLLYGGVQLIAGAVLIALLRPRTPALA
jgi:BASS family bile acid:Na+ symporter